MTTRWVIYCHTHTESGRRYVGLTKKTMLQRWNNHVLNAKRKLGKGCRHFWNAIRKYGPEAFTHEVLEVCHNLEVANLAEECWIELFDTRNPEKGFNLIRGGGHTPHPVKNPWDRPDYRARALEVARLKAVDPTWRAKVSSAMKVVASDPDWREHKSERAVRQRASPESRELVSSLWQDPSYQEKCSRSLRKSAASQAEKTHCPKGHEYTPENVFFVSRTVKGRVYKGRACRQCRRALERRRYDEQTSRS